MPSNTQDVFNPDPIYLDPVYYNNNEITMVQFVCKKASDPNTGLSTVLPANIINRVKKTHIQMSYYNSCPVTGYNPLINPPEYPLSSHIDVFGWEEINYVYPPDIDPETGKYRASKYVIVHYNEDGSVSTHNDLLKEELTEYFYDGWGNLTSTKINGETLFTKKFDSRGNELFFDDGKGNGFIKEYDRHNNVTYEKFTNDFEAWYIYNDDSRLIYYKNSQGDEMYYYYDEDGNLITQSPEALDIGIESSSGCIDVC